jgi:TonB family protein
MNAAIAQERWQGQVIDGRYPLLEWLGGAPHSAVFRTEIPGPQPQAAAIKLVRVDNNAAQQVSQWKNATRLSHSGLLRIFDAGFCQITGAQWIYCVTECAEENLDQVLPVRPLSTDEVRQLLPPVIEVLSFLHAKKLVHAALKPSNIFAIKNQLKLSADSILPAGETTRGRQLSAYDAPELQSGTMSPAADLWALGMTLIAVLEQRPLTWSKSAQADPAVPRSVPPIYRLIATECLRIDASARCSLQRIKELIHQTPAAPQLPVPVARKRNLTLPVFAGIVVAVLAVGLMIRHSAEKQIASPAAAQEQSAEPVSNAPEAAVPKAAARPTAAVRKSVPKILPTPVPTPVQTVHPATAAVAGTESAGVVERVIPQVPLSARLTIHGKVRVRVRVSTDSNGNVASASFVNPGPSKYFARLAMEASQKWKFKPAENGSAQQWLLEYKFGRSSTEVVPSAMH